MIHFALRRARARAGYSQRRLAQLVGISQTQLSRIETGDKPATAELLAKLDAVFGAAWRTEPEPWTRAVEKTADWESSAPANPAAAIAWYREVRDGDRLPDSSPSVRVRAAELADKARQLHEERSGTWVHRDAVSRALSTIGQVTRDRLSGVPARLHPHDVALAAAVRDALDEVLGDVAREIQGQIRAIIATPPSTS